MDFNKLPHMIAALREINETQIFVGVPHGNRFLTMIALVQENGAHIRAKNYEFLWIPTSNAKGRKPSQIPNLYIRRKKGADRAAAGVDDASQPYGFRVYFVLRKSVDIPARPFLRDTVLKNTHTWVERYAKPKAMQAALGQIEVKDYFNVLGAHAMNDLKDEIKRFSDPANAPLTTERKGFNNPLIDTKQMLRSMTYFSIRVR